MDSVQRKQTETQRCWVFAVSQSQVRLPVRGVNSEDDVVREVTFEQRPDGTRDKGMRRAL